MTSPCGTYVYGVPGTANTVLRIKTKGKGDDGTENGDDCCVDFLPDPTNAPWSRPGRFKWLRGVTVPPAPNFDGCCLALPCNATCGVLRISANGTADLLGGPFLDGGHAPLGTTEKAAKAQAGPEEWQRRWTYARPDWLYHGGALLQDGYVYAVPANAPRTLRIHPVTGECDYVGPAFPGRQKWYGGIVAQNGKMYGVPHTATTVLCVTPASSQYGDDATFETVGELPQGGWKWHGGAADASGRFVYGYPNNAAQVLKIDTEAEPPKISLIGDPKVLVSGRHRSDDKYKWLGGAVCPIDNNLYLFPSDAERVLCIETETDRVYTVGPELLEGPNKYQNGFAGRDGAVYGIPQRSPGILRILPSGSGTDRTVHVDELAIPDADITNNKHKFEGGEMGDDGNIYCIPLDTGKVVRVDVPPPKLLQEEEEEKKKEM